MKTHVYPCLLKESNMFHWSCPVQDVNGFLKKMLVHITCDSHHPSRQFFVWETTSIRRKRFRCLQVELFHVTQLVDYYVGQCHKPWWGFAWTNHCTNFPLGFDTVQLSMLSCCFRCCPLSVFAVSRKNFSFDPCMSPTTASVRTNISEAGSEASAEFDDTWRFHSRVCLWIV